MFNKKKSKARGSPSSFEYPPPMSADVYWRNGVAYKPIDVPSREKSFPQVDNRRSTRRHTCTSRSSHTHSCSDGRHSLNSSGSRMSNTSSTGTSNTLSRHHSRASFRTRANTPATPSPSESQSQLDVEGPEVVPPHEHRSCNEIPPAHSKTSNPPAGYLRTVNPYINTQTREKGTQLMRVYIPSINDTEWESKWRPGRKVKVLCPNKRTMMVKVPPRSHWQNDEHNALSYYFKVEYNPNSQKKELACTSCVPSLQVYDSECPVHGTCCSNSSDNLNEEEDEVSVAQEDVNRINPLDSINTPVQSSDNRKGWECKACSLINDEERVACEVCWTMRNQYSYITGI